MLHVCALLSAPLRAPITTAGLIRYEEISYRAWLDLPDYDLTVSGLAEAIGASRQSVNELLRERRAVSPEMALRLSRLFGNSPDFWLLHNGPWICGRPKRRYGKMCGGSARSLPPNHVAIDDRRLQA